MTPPRTMTGETFTDEKTPQSPASPTNTDSTLTGDAFIEIADDCHSTVRPSVRTDSSIDVESAQPENEKRRPKILHRITSSFRSEPEPEFVTETRTRKLEDTPNGFPRLAAFQSSEPNFSLYRSFSYLHSRILLDLQDEITTLEKELDDVDLDDSSEDPDRLMSRDYDISQPVGEGEVRSRRVILGEIRTKLLEYDEVLIKARKLEAFQKPSDRNYRSVRRYCHNTKPLMDSEMDSIRSKEDIVSLHTGREWLSFDAAVESTIGQVDDWLQKIFKTKTRPLLRYFRTPEAQAKTSDEYISLYSSARIDKVVNMLITLVIFCLLVIPIVLMYQLTSTAAHFEGESAAVAHANDRDTVKAVGVLMVFTLLFSAAMSLLTKAARHELFAASAAYCAILVVFIGNFTGPGS
ncbi:hypothetical protein BDW02DRAFT_10134 [Decorospora gaudefroyi]|uniref:DUF6594 domain-containing protein n=1 Tax=Decorospora gaudefroyi TaxID=184978 RepID=A0A6A5L0K3_9PLEO|nr:hypothetical protein BDW02DRAFT_10134 [Decorospora gaudefroyi]